MHDLNACVPCGGVSPGARPDEALLPALFALLPTPLAVGISVAPPETKVTLSCSCTRPFCEQKTELLQTGFCSTHMFQHGGSALCDEDSDSGVCRQQAS